MNSPPQAGAGVLAATSLKAAARVRAPATCVAEGRERHILEHLPQVRWIASSIHQKLHANVSVEDLISTGILGLIAAIDNFDSSRNAVLRTYAEYRIRGAILDSLKGFDGVPVHKRKRVKQVQAAIVEAAQRLHRAPQEEEIAVQLGISLSRYQNWMLELRGITLESLDSVASEENGGSLLRFIASGDEDSPFQIFEKAELQRMLVAAIKKLPQIERLIINLYFTEELTLQEIGKVIHLHTSRVSQLKLQAVLRMRSYIKRHWPERRDKI